MTFVLNVGLLPLLDCVMVTVGDAARSGHEPTAWPSTSPVSESTAHQSCRVVVLVGTVIAHVACTPPTAAVIVALPAATAVTSPLASTVATAGALDVHVIVALTGLPFASSGVALSCSVAPICTDADAGV